MALKEVSNYLSWNMVEDNVRKECVYIYIYIYIYYTYILYVYKAGSLCCTAEIDRTL